MTVHAAVGETRKVFGAFGTAATGVTVDLVRADGSVLVNDAATTDEGDGLYSYTLLPADVSRVDEIRATFSGTISGVARTVFDIVYVSGAHYFTIDDMRAEDISGKHSDRKLERARAASESLIERNCGTSFVGRYKQERGPAPRSSDLKLSNYVRSLISASINGSSVLADVDFEVRDTFLRRTSGWYGDVVVEYESGWSDLPPPDLRDAALEYARFKVATSSRQGIPAQATSLSTDVGTLQLAIAGLKHPTGIPDVDAVILGWAEHVRLPGF